MTSERYRRQVVLEGVGEEGQVKLSQAKVLVVGVGGLGCPALQYLATSGVGHLTIIDDDLVDITNLGRQILFSEDDVGQPKVEAAEQKLKRLNPEISVRALRARFSQNNARELASQHDVVLDGSDNFTTKYLVNDACVLETVPYSHGGVLRWSGNVMTYLPGGPCLRCLFEDAPDAEDVPNCSEVGTLGAVAGIIASLQATEVSKLILGHHSDVLSGALLSVDAKTMNLRKINFPKNSECPICGDQPIIIEAIEEGTVQCNLKSDHADNTLILTFEGQHRVIKAERHLKKAGWSVEPKVTPRQLSNECGICLEVTNVPLAQVQERLEQIQVPAIRIGHPLQFDRDELS